SIARIFRRSADAAAIHHPGVPHRDDGLVARNVPAAGTVDSAGNGTSNRTLNRALDQTSDGTGWCAVASIMDRAISGAPGGRSHALPSHLKAASKCSTSTIGRCSFAWSASGRDDESRDRPYAGTDMSNKLAAPARTYRIRTFGCQMNVNDAEHLAGLLEEAGYRRAEDDNDADVVVFNTCAVRENADNRLYGNLGQLAPVKARRPGMQIAVGGCLAQKDRGEIARRAPWVDVVFGTHNLGSLPVLLERARVLGEAQVEIKDYLETFPSTLPTRRESSYSAWVAISVGCNNTCTFCIVPSLRGKEKDRRPGEILAEVRTLVEQGVLEVTLLGQNVNTYGVEFGDRLAFG